FHQLYAVTAQRDGFTGRPLGYFQKLWDVLEHKGLIKLFITEFEGQALSAAICFVLPPQCWYVYGASSNEHRKVMPNHAMQWAMMQWAKERDCTLYDFRGVADEGSAPTANATNGAEAKPEASKPEAEKSEADNHLQGLNRFKAGFGAHVVSYVGEWDLPLDKKWYWLWTTARPKVVAAMKKAKK
ncbi:MAG TPA: peptidoglycan bridge formation glycyltransferase FemA/FemB family protein, partial [Abditibacteriaceae bacterium]